MYVLLNSNTEQSFLNNLNSLKKVNDLEKFTSYIVKNWYEKPELWTRFQRDKVFTTGQRTTNRLENLTEK